MGLTERLQVIATHKEPSNKHILWLKDNTFRKWDGDGWVDIGGGNGTTDYKALKNKPLINGRVLEGNINLEIKGEKGDTGPKGEQGIQGIQGLTGKDGIGISKVEQIVYSNEDSGENIVRVTLEDGTFTDITILNGSKGTSEDDIQIINIELDEEYIKAYKEGSLNWDGVIRNPVPLMQLSTTIEAGKYTKVVANEKDVLIEGYSVAIQDNGIRYVALLGTDKVANTKFQIEKNLVIANLGNMTVLRMPLIYKLHINIKDDEVTRQDPETFLAIKDTLLNSINEGLYPYLQISRSYNISETSLKGSYAYLVPSTSSDDINCLQFKTEDGSLYININDTTGIVESVKDYNMDPIMVYKAIDEAKNSVDSGEGSDSSHKTYVFYIDEELTEEKIEANKRAYEAAMAETPALYVISSYGDIIVPTVTYISRDGDSYVRFGISLNDEIVNSEARNREYLDVFNTQIRFAEDGTFTIHKQFESRLAKVSMLDEVIAKVDEIPDRIANIPQGEKFYYVHIPFEDYPLDEEQLAENAASCTKWLEAYKNNEPLPILCLAEFPNGEGRLNAYQSSDSSLGFFLKMTLGVGNDESFDNVEFVGMLFVNGLLYSTGEVELFISPDEKVLPTINSFKTINGQSIFGEGDIEIQGGNGGGAEVRTLFVNDAGLSADELSYNAETVQLIFAQHPMIFYASSEEGTPLSEYELMGMDNGRMVFAKYELNEYSTEATYIYLAMDGSTEVGGFSKSELDGDKYDSSLDADSVNAVQNKVVTENIKALEAAMPLMAVIDLDTIIAQDTPIDNATRNALLELGGYTSGDKYFSKGWTWSRGYLYTIKVIPTDAGVQIHVLSLKGWCEILEDNSKVNHLPSQGGGSIEVDAELSETSENAVSNKAVTMALAETEEVTAAALNELNERVSNASTKEELAAALIDVDGKIQNTKDVIDTSIIDNEEIIAAALNDLNKKVNDVYTKDEINTNFTDVNNTLKSYVNSSIATAITNVLNTEI